MKTVYVGMSGGVDSSVAAALLKEKGYAVTGVYMKNWTQDLPGLPCPWKDDFQDAKRVAVQLGIDFKVYDFQTEYRQQVVDYMIEAYELGLTPNPDIICNQEVKFKLFLEAALSDGADFIATGHYAKTSNGQLLRAANREKDQTYFLYRVTQAALKKTIFPIGDISSKSEVRQLAQKFNLVTAAKKDSQGICFVGKVGIKEFLEQFVHAEQGPIINQHGEKIGLHEGALFYTIGQRHGLNVGGGLPYYVIAKDMSTNTVFVTSDIDDRRLWTARVTLHQAHWINEQPISGRIYGVQLRYRGPLIETTLHKQNTGWELRMSEPARAISAGQSAVLYEGERVVGGGVIV